VHHDEVIREAVAIVAATEQATVTAAWLSSLSSRDLAARSAFGSYVVLQHMPEHEFTPSAVFHPTNFGVCWMRPEVGTPVPGRPTALQRRIRHR
jgi:hypothetical protein